MSRGRRGRRVGGAVALIPCRAIWHSPGTDIDMKYLQGLAAPNLEIRRHDILKDEPLKPEYDLVHCRKMVRTCLSPKKP